jgi:hypothetical protein
MHRRLLVITALLVVFCWLREALHAHGAQHEYFDAHNHNYSGILPYYAYADLESFIQNPGNPAKIDLAHRRLLWQFLAAFSYQGSRYSPGALATVKEYGKPPDHLSEAQINGALERVLTTTPWTDFDSAYAFRGAPVYGFLTAHYHDRFPDSTQENAYISKQLCDASVIELAATDTTYSEQFINFLGGWGPAPSSKLENIRCFLKEPAALDAAGTFKAMGKPVPQIKSLLMTNTSELGAISKDGLEWMEYGSKGQCAVAKPELKVSPDDIRNALLGKDSSGVEIIQPQEEQEFFDGVVGIDTAGPEFTCFTAANVKLDQGAGMDNYKLLVRAVYSASRERHGAGWHGKLLVHTHVGEGGVRYLFNSGSLDSLFATFPAIQMDAATGVPVHIEQSKQNITRLLQAVRELRAEIRDLDSFVIFRFGHVTHADKQDAREMRALKIEADINLESNIATRAYWTPALAKPALEPLSEQQQFDYNDLVEKVVRSGHSAELLADHSLKYMLEAGVRTVLGSDGGGEEHSDIRREYQLAEELIRYWQSHDEEFKRLAPHDLSMDTFDHNARAHKRDMQSDKISEKQRN